MNVLSLFDGMSCGQQALERAGFKVDNYYASEIDKYAIKVTMDNYPSTIQLGDVRGIDGRSLPKIDLLLGGSPCQSFSFAGKRKGMATKDEQEILTLSRYLELKNEEYEFEGQSYLFWEYMRILNELREINPSIYFLLENVEMGEKWELVLNKAIDVKGIHINSSLVSAQNRRRIYWTNIGMKPQGLFGDLESIIEQPKDRGILLKDILQDNPNAKYYISTKMIEHLESRDTFKLKNGDDKSGTITVCGEGKQGNNSTFICEPVDEKYFLSEKMIEGFEKHNENHIAKGTGFLFSPTEGDKKAACLRANAALCATDNSIIVNNENSNSEEPSDDKHHYGNKRLNETLDKHKDDLEHQTFVDAYNKQIYKEKSPTITTRINDENHKYIYEAVGLTEVRTENAKKERKQKGSNKKRDKELAERTDGKTGALLTQNTPDNLIRVREVKQLSTNNKSNGGTQPYQQDRIYDINGISPALSAGKSDLMITSGTYRTHKDGEGFREVKSGKGATIPARSREDGSGQNVVMITQLNENQLKKFNPNVDADKSNTLTTAQGRAGSSDEYMDSVSKIAKLTSRIRRLTPVECERLQTMRDNYSACVSDSQRYKMIGNGWTIDVIVHILNYMPKNYE